MKMFLSFLASIRWQDILDILLNSYILFRFYVLFRGTYVFRVLTGIAILWIIQRIAVFFGLILTSWVMQGITAVAALIIIIVFRNEIRSVLQAKNLKAILWGFPHTTTLTPLEIIGDSVSALSRRKIGALIVFPAKEDLQDLTQSGIPWRGKISKEMILSIFWPDNPVHDGAAVIQGGQITDVGVILPLSYSDELPSQYGTRHRAALGLAETSDALVIAISEETGKVAVAKNASITALDDNTRIIDILGEHIGVKEKSGESLKKEKLTIGAAALISILFVTGIWASFSKGLDSMITIEIPVEYTNRDPGMEIVETSADTVSLHLAGSGTLIKSLRPEQVQVRLDLEKSVVGQNIFSITQDDITLPPGIFLKKVVPPVVEATLDKTIKKTLPVQVDWVGKLADNLILSEKTVSPEKVEVIGGERALQNISTIYTEKIQLDNIKKSGTTTVNLALNPASLKISLGSNKVRVNYIVQKRFLEGGSEL
jgi:uncharacterized protein (TIGR00159 family)